MFMKFSKLPLNLSIRFSKQLRGRNDSTTMTIKDRKETGGMKLKTETASLINFCLFYNKVT